MREFIGGLIAFLVFCAWQLMFVFFLISWHRHNVEDMVGYGISTVLITIGSLGSKR